MLSIDIHEPDDSLELIGPSIPCTKIALNNSGWADYYWQTKSGEDVHVERKQWGEVLTGIDKVEDQLRRHMSNKPKARLIFLLEGVGVPVEMGTEIVKQSNRSGIWTGNHTSFIRIPQVYAWLYGISKYMEVYQTSNYTATCMALVSFYKQDQKEEWEHKTFKRHFKSNDFHPNPQVVQLMGLLPGIGEKKAVALIKEFTTVWNVLSASPVRLAQIDGIGMKTASTILQRVGRTDV